KAILVSGLSGAGKTSATSILEDMGYHCIDQYPSSLLESFVQYVEHTTDPRFQNIALTIPLSDLVDFQRAFKGTDIQVQTLYLEASDDTLLSRYKSTRRTHPYLLKNRANTLEESIVEEIKDLRAIKNEGSLTIDTTHLKYNELKTKIERAFAINKEVSFSISFISFGYKNGIPLDVDLMFDVRFLPNPYWEEELRAFSGDDACVYDYVMKSEEGIEFSHVLTNFLEYMFLKYVREGKNHLTVAIGCTGGQHRSVSITNYLYDYYQEQFTVYKEHRDRQDVYHG
ncbi:MAG: RNase adapter RapZ, partial [Erysipelotrichaceae bacterium]